MLKSFCARCVTHGPQLLRLPLQLTPFALKKPLLQQLLNLAFRQVLAEGELDFLQQRWLGIEIRDLALRWAVTLEHGRLRVDERDDADVWFRGDANDLLLIMARKVDPDTLFFQRRLVIEGDTELGLAVKNLLDATELDTLPAVLRTGLLQLAAFVESGLKTTAQRQADVSC